MACLVFLQHYLPAFAPRHDAEKLAGILRKTWRKMSARGQAAALRLDLDPGLRELVEAGRVSAGLSPDGLPAARQKAAARLPMIE